MAGQTKLYYFRSTDREDYSASPTDMIIHLRDKADIRDKVMIQIKHCSIPFTFYTIQTGLNDKFYFNEGGSDLTVTIPAGNYTIDNLCTALETLMTAAGSDTHTVNYSINTGKVTISSDGTTLSLLTSNTTAALWGVLGFLTTANHTGATSYTGENHSNILHNVGYNLLLEVDFSNLPIMYATQDRGQSRVCHLIPISSSFGFGDLFQLTNINPSEGIYVSAWSEVDKIRVRLLHENFQLVDLNGAPWSFMMSVHTAE